eukprot:TRINITY_DN3454_c0_g1_i5.p1 TRINITY_DN3454_c0_g1~~TRINITY_DN3454_c0_g1_i5.p1  ORF type:complete len:476 (+),score=52.25 TRINITY_DN3454_c0_g1_i5:218-1645(+)
MSHHPTPYTSGQLPILTVSSSVFNWWDEMKIMLTLVGPAIIAQSCFILMNLTDSIFVGFVGQDEFAACALGNAFSWCIFYFAIGISGGLDTLVAQAFGARNNKLVGIFFQTSLVCSTIVCIPVIIICWFAGDIFAAVGQEPHLAKLAGGYVRYLMASAWPLSLFYCISKYLQNQNIMNPSMIVGVLGIALNALFNYIFVVVLDWGLNGSGGATTLARFLMPIILWVYVAIRGHHKDTSPVFYREAVSLTYVWKFFRYAIPATVMVAAEVFSFEVMVILVGLFKRVVMVEAHAVGYYVIIFCFVFPFGWSVAINVRVGNLLGEGRPEMIPKYIVLGYVGILMWSTCLSVIAWLLRYQIVSIWSHDLKIRDYVADFVALAALAHWFDSLQYTGGAYLRGAGRQDIGMIIVLIGHYLVSLPVGSILAFLTPLKLYGYWSALIIALGLMDFAFFRVHHEIGLEPRIQAGKGKSKGRWKS